MDCADVDDCSGNPCTDHGTCSDTGPNSYACVCDDGFTFTNRLNCTELFNCQSSETHDCDANAECNHEWPGVHSCACNQGFSGNGTFSCADTDGCLGSPCFDHADVECHDTPAAQDEGGASSFRCDACPSGWAGDGVDCADVDDCSGNPCTDHGTCSDTGPNSYACVCDDGFTFTNRLNCTELFNCQSSETHDCDANAECNHEWPGVHSCACNQGFSGNGTFSCADTDGCLGSPCFDHADVECHDTPAAQDEGGASSFRCDACPSGWAGDGVDCADIRGSNCVGYAGAYAVQIATDGPDITWRITLTLSGSYANVYSIYGTEASPMIIPASYQEAVPFGTNTGGVNPAFLDISATAVRDGWLIVGLTEGDDASTIVSVGIDWERWTADVGIEDNDAAIFWMNPDNGPAGSAVIAQFTIAGEWSASFGAQGRSSEGGMSDDWDADNIALTSGDIDNCADAPCGEQGTCTDTGASGYDCVCNVGWVFNATSCISCAAGLADLDSDPSTPCDNCATGHVSAAGATSCTACARGTADLDEDAATACDACEAGFFAPEAGVNCTHCPAGYHDEDQDASTPCDGDDSRCPAGTHTVEGSSSCPSCESGQADTDGDPTTACAGCPVGTFSSEQATSCDVCAAGQADLDQQADTACTMCGAGTFSGPESTSCTNCAAGRYVEGVGSAEAGDCIDCAAGKYVEAAGSDEAGDCTDCDAGRYVEATGSTSARACIECSAGTFVEATGSDRGSDCIGCAAGTYAEVAGSDSTSDCIDCVAGTYVDSTGSDQASDCIACVAGTYAETASNDASSDCIDCSAGTFSTTVGSDSASDCIDCVAGTHSSTAGSAVERDCIECSGGQFSTVVGSESSGDCIDCVCRDVHEHTGQQRRVRLHQLRCRVVPSRLDRLHRLQHGPIL